MKIITQKKLEGIRRGDVGALVALDDAGLILGPDESLEHFAERLEGLQNSIRQLKEELDVHGECDMYGVRLVKKDAIPKDVFATARRTTRELYGFSVDWVPGFFTDDRMGLLFAGCAMYPPDNFFAVFVIRKSFQKHDKWWIYSRKELITHELTHIAHLGFRTPNFEEHLAYQTSESGFRKLLGGMFRTPKDSYLVLGAMFSLLVAQLINIRIRPPEEMWAMPMPLCFAAGLGAVFWVIGRYMIQRRKFKQARESVAAAFPERFSLAVLFRCSEEEIAELAGLPESDVARWVDAKAADDIRWQVICARFRKNESASVPVAKA